MTLHRTPEFIHYCTYHTESIAYYSLGRKRILAELSTTYHIFWQSSDAEISLLPCPIPDPLHAARPILAIRLHSVSRSVQWWHSGLTEGEGRRSAFLVATHGRRSSQSRGRRSINPAILRRLKLYIYAFPFPSFSAFSLGFS